MIGTRDSVLQDYAHALAAGMALQSDDLEQFFDFLIAETDKQVLADVFAAWDAKGITEDELFGLVTLMRSRMNRIQPVAEIVVDIVGTGGSSAKTFNVSTAAALVAAGAGISIAKHGNRAATSSSGSSDVLSILGVNPDVSPQTAEQCLNEIGICFMFAPRFHSLSAPLAAARRKFGRPTIFNLLGPLCNPAGATHQLIGVWDHARLELTASVLARLGTERSWVVHGSNGLDEITLGDTVVAEIDSANVKRSTISSSDLRVGSPNGGLPTSLSPAESGGLIQAILNDQMRDHAAEYLVLMNAAAAIYLADGAETLHESVDLARDSIRSGNALAKLYALREATAS